MVKAVIGWLVARRAAASTAEESTPPDRKAPTGTSACMCRAVVSRSMARIRSVQAAAVTPSSTAKRGRQ